VEPAIAAADLVFLSVNTATKARGIGGLPLPTPTKEV
jgi:hypothetical protein